MIRFGLALLILALGSPLSAQNVVVRSGEHDGYTRLVFQVPAETSWQLSHQKNGARLTVEIEGVTFDTGAVFSRLQTNRVKTLTQSKAGDAMQLEFGCDCVASAFLYRDTMIVVDIAAGAVLPPLALDIPPPFAKRAENPPEQPRSPALTDLSPVPLLLLGEEQFEEQLTARLLQGADREVLNLQLAPLGPRTSIDPQGLDLPAGLSANIGISSVLDDLAGVLGPELAQLNAKPACIATAELDFANWSDGSPFLNQVSALRSDLFLEFDRIDPGKVAQLARLYVYHGFGVEALRTLDLLQTQPAKSEWTAAIADVVDGRRSNSDTPFRGLQRCDSDAALWAVLSEAELSDDAHLSAIEQSFAQLPTHLRRSLGPELAPILVDAGKLEAARRVLRSVERLESETPADALQAKARIASAAGDNFQAETLLTQVIAAPDAALDAPIALARLVEKRWQDKGTVTLDELNLAAAYAVEFRRSEIGSTMTRAHAVALSLTNEFDHAVAIAREIQDSGERIATLDRVVHVLAERSDDVTFLFRSLDLTNDETAALTVDTAIAMSDRLIELGFTSQALTLLNRPQDTIKRSERARLRARAALQNNRPHQAMLELSDDASQDADLLRVQALIATRDFAAAGALLRAIGDTQAAGRYLWLAGTPNKIEPGSTEKYEQIGAITGTLSDPPRRIPDKPLADAAGLLTDSAETRAGVQALLDAVYSKAEAQPGGS